MNQGGESSGNENNPKEGYANRFKVGFDAFKFLIDFGLYFPISGETHYYTRVVMNPLHAKVLLETLRESIEQYEQAYGITPEE